MAVTYGFYNALNHDRVYDAIQMSSIFDGIIRDGVFSTIGESLICKASESGLVVNVGAGRAWFDHTWTLNDTDYPVEAEQAEVVLDRIDAVVLEVNSAVEVRANTIKFIKGTPSANPVRPTLVHNAEVNQYALAYVSIRAGQTTIFQSDITNVVGSDETPFITGLLQQLSIEQIVLQWEDEFDTWMRDNNVAYTEWTTTMQNQFNSWMNTKMNEYAQWYGHMQEEGAADLAEFDAWFQHMKDQLDEDAAGHLQAEIDALALDAEKGSIVRVTTTDDTLINKTVTIVQNEQSLSTTFSAEKIADFPSVPMIGDMRITSSNGVLTAIKDINIPYFGRYTYNLEFWEATLNIVSGDSGLYGRAVYISKGGTVVGSTVFDNTGHATYKVHEAGTYTISCTSTGGTTYEETVEVTDETVYEVSMGLPDGSTVTPVNDIQIWLKCAGLDKNYTTLAEVLADTSTFDTLLRDSNACNYMARSTGWAAGKGEGLVPRMTSATAPSGAVTASSYYNDGNTYLPFRAFDNFDRTSWLSANGQVANSWIQYEFPEAVKVNAVRLVSLYHATQDPTYAIQNYKIQASADGSTFTTLYTGVNTDKEEVIEVSINNSSTYKYYRVVIVDTFGGVYSGFREVQFYANPLGLIVDTEEPMARIGKYDYCSDMLLANETWCAAIKDSKYIDEILDIKIPIMTSDSAPSGVASAESAYNANYAAWKAFNGEDAGVASTYWNSAAGHNPTWVKYAFPSSIIPRTIRYSLLNASGRNSDWYIQVSNDDINWETVITIPYTETASVSIGTINFNFEGRPYRYVRAYTPSGVAAGLGAIVYELQMWGRKTSAFNYTPLVPAMTSDTTPSGECIGTPGSGGYHVYLAFDQTSTDMYDKYVLELSAPSDDVYLGYHFPTPQVVNAFDYTGNKDAPLLMPTKVRLQASNDGETWVNLSDEITHTTADTATHFVNIDNQTAYSYYRLKCSSRQYSSTIWYVQMSEIQFYSKSIKQTIHSCPNSAVYYKEGGNDITLCETDATGLAEVDWTIFPHGNVTLYSTVAKDPDNLSNDYSKTVFITNTSKGHTTELYLMPDPVKTLYWYGYIDGNGEDILGVNGWTVNSPYTMVGLTHNTNSLYGATGTADQHIYKGFGSKNQISVSKIHSIGNYTTRINPGYSYFVVFPIKDLSSGVHGTWIQTSGLNHTSLDIPSQYQSGVYLGQGFQDGAVGTLYALWYE